MKRAALLIALVLPFTARAAEPDAFSSLCATNPAFSLPVMRSILNAQLQKDHDASLDAAPPEQLAKQAVDQGIADCASDMRRDPGAYQALAALSGPELEIGWDAYNTACADHSASKGACVTAELGAQRALKRMMATNEPAGAKLLVQTCELVLQTDPSMTDWRVCVDQGLAMHASGDALAACKISVPWHTAKTGAEAGQSVTGCLGRNK